CRPGSCVNLQCVQAQYGIVDQRPPSKQRSNPRQQLTNIEGFHEVIVCAEIEPFHPLLVRPACSQHQNGDLQTGFTQLATDCPTILERQTYIENDQIEWAGERFCRSSLSIQRHLHRMRFLSKSLGNHECCFFLIFDQQ